MFKTNALKNWEHHQFSLSRGHESQVPMHGYNAVQLGRTVFTLTLDIPPLPSLDHGLHGLPEVTFQFHPANFEASTVTWRMRFNQENGGLNGV